jgi:lipopolysaccharide/colanic/teichoic acid biosynthesis glycosyltransferase
VPTLSDRGDVGGGDAQPAFPSSATGKEGVNLEGAAQDDRFARLTGAGNPAVAAQTYGLTSAGGGEPAVLDLDGTVFLPDIDLEPTVFLPEAEPAGRGLLGARAWQVVAKRAIDVVGSMVLLAVLTPLLLVVALAVRIGSPGPILYRQRRVGLDGEYFTMLKFRSMHDGAHELRHIHAHANETTGPVFKIRDDPRVNGVGRVIRRLSIDELPQLVNVLAGQMSLVGPRPPLPEECEFYTDHEMRRLQVKPGITCAWQVSGRSELDFDTWVDMDLEYIETWTLRQDLLLLLRTIPAVFSRRGAY